MTLPVDAVPRLRLIRTDSIGPITYRQLLARFGTPAAALAALPDLARCGGRALAVTPVADAEAELAALDAICATMIFIGTQAYPALLAALETAPPVLAARGDTGLLERPVVAVVGAHNASAAGAFCKGAGSRPGGGESCRRVGAGARHRCRNASGGNGRGHDRGGGRRSRCRLPAR